MAALPLKSGDGDTRTTRSVFELYDTNGDGVLDRDEVTAMIDAIGYEVDSSYVGGVLEIFGKFDTDSDGTIDLTEFPRLWEHLGGDPLAVEDDKAVSTPLSGPRSTMQTSRSVFELYDTNGDGVLDRDEVTAMIDAIGYEVDSSYVGGVLEIFGKFDTDSDGTIDLTEFPRLWEHMGGDPLAVEEEKRVVVQPAGGKTPGTTIFYQQGGGESSDSRTKKSSDTKTKKSTDKVEQRKSSGSMAVSIGELLS